MEHEAGKSDEVQARQHPWQALIIASEAAKARGPGEVALDDPATRQQDEAVLGLGQLDDLELDAVGRGVRRRLVARVPLVDVGQLHVLAGGLLHRRRQGGDLGAILRVGRGDDQGQQVPERVNSGMHRRALAPRVPVVTGPRPALGRRLQRAAVQNGGPRLARAAGVQAQEQAQVGDDRLKDADIEPASGLCIDDVPRRQVVRQPAPGGTRMHHPARGVEDLAQVVAPLRCVGADQGQIGGDEGPFRVADVTRVGFAGRRGVRVRVGG